MCAPRRQMFSGKNPWVFGPGGELKVDNNFLSPAGVEAMKRLPQFYKIICRWVSLG